MRNTPKKSEPHDSSTGDTRQEDGSKAAETYENMWDLTPDTDLLMELPEEYNFETALADLIDNSLQAVWSNDVNDRRLVSVEVNKDRITIFDTGPGMDGSDENSIVKWGKMGASLHRSSRGRGIGGKPPYLMPVFGMFGYGGPIASMHLGRRALVSSKTKESKMVYTLHLEREALLSRSGSEKTWRTDGGIRHPTEDEISWSSPQGSFTKVEIFKPKMKELDILQLQCKLKDIYFPYIQCDEVSKTCRTIMPVEFQVNGTDLAEIQGGEVAITNLHSCNGPEFVLQLRFSQDATSGPGVRVSQEANARLRFVYFPVVEGKENIERILENVKAGGCGIRENFESFSRVSIWRLGRLLPDARWKRLPFMEPRKKIGDKGQTLKRCCSRVKCFIDTDAGFNPTPSKTDLAHHHPYTTVLRNFGDKRPETDKEVKLEISKDGKQVTLPQLEKQYDEWIFQMHDRYDEVIERGEDQPLLVVSPSNKKKLGISSDVLRVHKEIQRKGASWKSGQKIKVLKGACTGCHKNNMYATLECIVLEGFQGDSGGEARVICSPLGLPSENGCVLSVQDDGNTGIDIGSSISIPISVIDSGKCMAIEAAEWESQVQKQRQKMPSTIELLSARHCQELEVEGPLPTTVYAGHVPPSEIVAVVRPASYNCASASKNLDQKHIVISKEDLEMCMQIKLIYSCLVSFMNFASDGFQNFTNYDDSPLPTTVYAGHVPPSEIVAVVRPASYNCASASKNLDQKHIVISKEDLEMCMQIKLRAADKSIKDIRHIYSRCIKPSPRKEVSIRIVSGGGVLASVNTMKLDLSLDQLTLKIKDTLIECYELDKIKPNYEATLVVSGPDELSSVSIPCQVLPGTFHSVRTLPRNLDKQLLPGHAIKELILEVYGTLMFDAYGNHVDRGLEVQLNVDGFSFQDHKGSIRKVDQRGCVDLSSVLKVTGGYGRRFLISEKTIFKKEFETEKRELRILSEDSSALVSSKVGHDCQFSDGKLLLLQDSSAPKDVKEFVFAIMDDQKELEEAVIAHGLRIKDCETALTELNACQVELKEELSILQGCGISAEVGLLGLEELKASSIQDPSVLKHVGHSDSCSNAMDGMPNGAPYQAERVLCTAKKYEKDIQMLGLRIKKHEENIKFLKSQKNSLDDSILDMQVSLGNYHSSSSPVIKDEDRTRMKSEEETLEDIIRHEKSAASILCLLKTRHASQTPHLALSKDVLGVVAQLGKLDDDNLSRLLSEYLGIETMLAVVCKTNEGVKALETYEKDGSITKNSGIHELGISIGRQLDGRFLVICLENLRASINVKFPKGCGTSTLPANYLETEKLIKEMKWKGEKIQEDMQREQALLNHAMFSFEVKKKEFVKYLAESSSHVTQYSTRVEACSQFDLVSPGNVLPPAPTTGDRHQLILILEALKAVILSNSKLTQFSIYHGTIYGTKCASSWTQKGFSN
ncbi:hypothetical protein RHGRI_008715 [Rhododendron griersonianum]|uniref:Uncharacterized protein n=1 Tax=Rhododendron griersonianum TaxID=479676 RepID=A0AAV6L4F8_9ERIC|nr:hypothetical protein RHGRI_008715 [Rhododendron griersonianum]